MNDDDTISWGALLDETVDRLGGDRREARWICEEVAGVRGAAWTALVNQPVGERAVAHLDALVARRLTGEPLQYVLGSWAFRHLDLLVDRRVLIPRPETELIVDVALELLADLPRPLVLADLGTGTGAIGLSLAHELPLGAAEIWLTDRSDDALDVARANLAGIGRAAAHVRIASGSWFEALPEVLAGRLDLVATNPPYIALDDPEVAEDVTAWEPAEALFAGADGFDDLRVILGAAPRWLRPGGWLVAEVGHRQGADAVDAARLAGLVDVSIRSDLADRDRILVARRPN
ncbi:MAG: peptide chain release factor N(5)-glutamine methyltransferase [Ilumatobacteraceae bacterium]